MSGSWRKVQALTVVGAQTAFVAGGSAGPAAAALLTVLTSLLAQARQAGTVVVQLQNDGSPGAADEPRTPGWELLLPPAARAGEYVIRKDTAHLDLPADQRFREAAMSFLAHGELRRP